jgi:hypothetical protein
MWAYESVALPRLRAAVLSPMPGERRRGRSSRGLDAGRRGRSSSRHPGHISLFCRWKRAVNSDRSRVGGPDIPGYHALARSCLSTDSRLVRASPRARAGARSTTGAESAAGNFLAAARSLYRFYIVVVCPASCLYARRRRLGASPSLLWEQIRESGLCSRKPIDSALPQSMN